MGKEGVVEQFKNEGNDRQTKRATVLESRRRIDLRSRAQTQRLEGVVNPVVGQTIEREEKIQRSTREAETAWLDCSSQICLD